MTKYRLSPPRTKRDSNSEKKGHGLSYQNCVAFALPMGKSTEEAYFLLIF